MKNLLEYEGNQLSVLTKQDVDNVNNIGDVLFCAREVARILGYQNERDAVLKYVDATDKVKLKNNNILNNNFRKLHNTGEIFINESGLYSLIFTSNLKSAKKFKKWVTSEVLPSIRETGSYSLVKKEDTLGSLIEKEILMTIEEKLEERLNTYKVKQITEAIAAFRAYGITKKKSIELAAKVFKLNSTVESVLNSYMQDNYEEERRRNIGKIKAYIKDLVDLGYSHQDAWNLFANEVLHSTGYDLKKTRTYLREKEKPNATYLDACNKCNILKDSVTIVKRLVNKKIKEQKKKTA